MPFVPDDPTLLRGGVGVAPAPQEPPPNQGAVADAAFRQQNEIVSWLTALKNSGSFEPQPGYDPLTDIRGTPYAERHLSSFLNSRSPAETESIMRQIDQEERDRRTLDAAGTSGLITQMVAGALSPTMLIPGGVVVKAGKEGYTFGRAALATGAAAMVQAGTQETLLQSSQATRTAGESAMNVASATILAGLLGPGFAALAKPEQEALSAAMDRTRAEMDAHAGNPQTVPPGRQEAAGAAGAGGVAGEAPAAGSAQAVSAGAAAADQRQLDIGSVGRVLPQVSPSRRVMVSSSIPARRTMADLAELPYQFEDNKGGVATTQGPSLETLARTEIQGKRVAVSDELQRQFSDYRYGQPDITLPGVRAMADRLFGEATDKLSLKDFKLEVGKAMQEGDQHDIPQVAAAAQYIRNKVFDPWKQRAIDAGMLPEDVGVKTADSYFQRVWNREAIQANRPEFVNRVTNWLKSDQETKAAAQTRLQAYSNGLEVAQAQIKKISSQIEARRGTLAGLETRQEEIQRLNQFAFKRSSKMSAPLDEMRARIRSIEASIDPHLQRLQQLAEDIKAEKVNFPEIKAADALIFKMIGAAQKLKQSRELIDTVDSASEYVDALDQTIAGFRGGIREAAAQAKLARVGLGADALVALEKEKAALAKEIAPQLKELRKIRRDLREEHAARIQKAQGGAVFETQIRNRGNTLADRASGKDAEIASLEAALDREIANHDAVRTKIENEIAAWEGKSVVEAKAALKAREKYIAEAQAAGKTPGEKGRLTGADSAVDAAVKKILASDRNLSDQELRSRAQEVTDRVLGTPDGRLPYDAHNGGPRVGWTPGAGEPPRGALAARDFMIPDAQIRDFLEMDPEHVVGLHLRTVVPDVLLAERFGDTRMTDALKQVLEDYAARIDATTSEKTRVKLGRERDAVIRDLAAVRDRIRGVYGWSGDLRNMARVAQGAKAVNNLTSMGMSTISSLPDMAGPVFRHGLTAAFGQGWMPFFRAMTRSDGGAWTKFKTQMRALGIGTETAINARQHAIDDVMDLYRPQSRFERALQWSSDKFFVANLLAPWTDTAKMISAHIVTSEILRAVKASAAGKATKKQITDLAAGGIDAQMAARIHRQFFEEGHGQTTEGVHLPNTADWTDQGAARALEGAVTRDVDISVVTPGQEKPLWMSHPVLSILGQFQSFVGSSTERILLANLQRHDAQVLQGLMASLALGMISYKVNALLGGQAVSDRPQDWVKESISRGGLLGWLENGNALTSKLTRGSVDIYRVIGADKPLSRYASRSALDMFLGPTAGKLDNLIRVTSAAGGGEWNEGDTRAVRRLVALQNLFYLRLMFDQVEAGANGAFGIPMKQKPQ